jgi:predicted ATPase/class 3 adenylate cyclase
VESACRPPEGTIALLFTDIEGSTQLAARLGAGWPEVLAVHHELVGGAIAAESGFVDGTEGDAFFATFVDAAAAARAAVASLRALRAYGWPAEVGQLAVRMGLHVGFVERRATGYVGLEVHRAARVAAAAHGGQLLLTGAARALVGEVVVVEPLGVHRLKDFPSPEPLFCAVVDGRGAAAFPPPRTEGVRPTNLPAGRPTLMGRNVELEQARRALLVEGERLVTLVGRGGVGKTTLALVAARELLDEYSGGVWLVRLAGAVSTDDVFAAVAAAIGADGDLSTSSRDLVVSRLRDRGPVLVLLDNFEHLLAAAPAVGALLDELSELQLLVTSQAPLRLGVERCLRVGALDHESALALIERVARRRGATPGGVRGDRAALLEVVELLDGLPLGLELAAARLGVLSAAQVLDRLRGSPDLLSDPGSNRPDRQRSLRATVQWTLGLLADDARAVFVRMGAFAGPVGLTDLEAVVGEDGVDVLEALASLLDFALVRRVESGDGAIRFELPEALRQIAAGLLDAAADGRRWRAAHARHQCDLAWAARTVVVEAGVFRRASAADAEATAALRWAWAVGDPAAARLAAARAVVLADNGRGRDAITMLEPLVAQPTGHAEVDGLALSAQAFALAVLGRMTEALGSAVQAVRVTVSCDLETRTFALLVCGLVRTYTGDADASVRDFQQAIEMARDLDAAALAGALLYSAQARMVAGDLDQARHELDQATHIGRPVDAKALWHVDTLSGDLAVLSGRPLEALEPYVRSLEAAQTRGDQLQIFHDLWGMANVLAILRDDDAASEIVGLAEGQGYDVRGPDGTPEHLVGLDAIAIAQERIGAARAADLKAHGRVVSAGQRVRTACRLARAAGSRHDHPA